MVSLAEACEVISGIAADPLGPWALSDDGSGPVITRWDATVIGRAAPTPDETSAVTPETVAAFRRRRAAGAALMRMVSSDAPTDVLLRVVLRDLYRQVRDLREQAGLPVATEPQVVARLLAAAPTDSAAIETP